MRQLGMQRCSVPDLTCMYMPAAPGRDYSLDKAAQNTRGEGASLAAHPATSSKDFQPLACCSFEIEGKRRWIWVCLENRPSWRCCVGCSGVSRTIAHCRRWRDGVGATWDQACLLHSTASSACHFIRLGSVSHRQTKLTAGGEGVGLAAPVAAWYHGLRPMACCIQVIFSHCTCVQVSLSTSPPVSPEFAFQDQKHRSCRQQFEAVTSVGSQVCIVPGIIVHQPGIAPEPKMSAPEAQVPQQHARG